MIFIIFVCIFALLRADDCPSGYINNLSDWYDLPYSDDAYNSKNMEVGFGELFGVRTPHHKSVLWLCLLISLSTLIWVVVSSISQVNKKMEEIHNEPIE